MKLHQRIGCIASGLLLAAFSIAVPLPAAAETVPPGVVGAVTVNGSTTYYYDTPVSGGVQAMWNEAASAKIATVKLYTDWIAEGSMLIGSGAGSTENGGLSVPSGTEITLDLNGHTIDRGLSIAMEKGAVIIVEPQGALNLTDTSSSHQGILTGGSSTDTAGGIQVGEGASLKLWGGKITGNETEASGGGIFLAGSGSSLYMTGGTVTGNSAGTSGGGIAVVDGSMRIVSGDFTDNTSGGTGGGMYLQGGSAELSKCKVTGNQAVIGGGICTNTDAQLTLKDGTLVQKNKLTGSADDEDSSDSAGGGIIAMSTRPIQFEGAPSVSMNTDAGGRQSNLVFWVGNGGTYASGRIEDAGISGSARIGVSFVGGSDRDMCLAASWPQRSTLSMDSSQFTLIEKEGALYLRRPGKLPGTGILIMIGCGTALVLALIGGLVMSIILKKRKKKHRRRKKTA